MSHNRKLDGLLSSVTLIAHNATNEAGLLSVFPMVRDFQRNVGPIKYDNRAKWCVFAAIGAAGLGFAIAFFLSPELQETLDVFGFGIMAAFVVALLVLGIVIGTANGAIDEISELIYRMNIMHDNRLTAVDVEGRKKELYRESKEQFGDFRSRGDEDRYISRLVKSEWVGREHSFPYEYYVFHYVRVYYVPVTRKVGKMTITTMERRTQTLYRYGLILDFPYVKGFAAASGGGSYDYPEGFQPASEEFNRAFAVSAGTAQTAAKFLKPAVVLAFMNLSKRFDGLNVEINRAGRMNIAFSDSDVLDLDRRHSIAETDEFEREIRSQLDLPKLRLLLEFVETLKRHSDANF